jgi:hypothetical protein
MAGETGEESFR